jgi:hypothetical protein
MRTINARQVTFGLMIVVVAVCGFAYAGNSTPWAGAAFAAAPGGSTPAPPVNIHATAVTPTTIHLAWSPAPFAEGVAVPWGYQLSVDGVADPFGHSAAEATVTSLVPGTLHVYTVMAYQGMGSDPSAPFTFTQPKAPVTLGRPSAPKTGKTNRAAKVSGTVGSAYALNGSMVVKLKLYRWQTKSGRKQWVLRKTVTAKRFGATGYYLSVKFKPAGTWSVVASTAGDATHATATSIRSRSIKVK